MKHFKLCLRTSMVLLSACLLFLSACKEEQPQKALSVAAIEIDADGYTVSKELQPTVQLKFKPDGSSVGLDWSFEPENIIAIDTTTLKLSVLQPTNQEEKVVLRARSKDGTIVSNKITFTVPASNYIILEAEANNLIEGNTTRLTVTHSETIDSSAIQLLFEPTDILQFIEGQLYVVGEVQDSLTVSITALTNDGLVSSNTVYVTVYAKPAILVKSFDIPENIELFTEDKFTLEVTNILPDTADNKAFNFRLKDGYSLISLENETTNSVTITSKSELGTAHIIVESTDGNVQKECIVEVKTRVVPIESFSVTEEFTLRNGESATLEVTDILPETSTETKFLFNIVKGGSYLHITNQTETTLSFTANGITETTEAEITILSELGTISKTCRIHLVVDVEDFTLPEKIYLENGTPETVEVTNILPETATDKSFTFTLEGTENIAISDQTATAVTLTCSNITTQTEATLKVSSNDGKTTKTCPIIMVNKIPEITGYKLNGEDVNDPNKSEGYGGTHTLGAKFTLKITDIQPADAIADFNFETNSPKIEFKEVTPTSVTFSPQANINLTERVAITISPKTGGKSYKYLILFVTGGTPVTAFDFPTSKTMEINDEWNIEATNFLPDNASMRMVDMIIEGDPNIIQLTKINGTTCKIKALRDGKVKVKAITRDGSDIEHECEITVNPRVLVNNFDFPTELVLPYASPAKTINIENLTPTNAYNKKIIFDLEVTSGMPIVTLSNITDNSVTITPITAGSINLTAKSADGNVVKTCKITVQEPIRVTNFDFPDKITIQVGKDGQVLTASNFMPKEATYNSVSFDVEQTGDIISLSGITANTVKVNPKKEGKAYVIAKTTDGGNVIKRCEVTVLPVDKSMLNGTYVGTLSDPTGEYIKTPLPSGIQVANMNSATPTITTSECQMSYKAGFINVKITVPSLTFKIINIEDRGNGNFYIETEQKTDFQVTTSMGNFKGSLKITGTLSAHSANLDYAVQQSGVPVVGTINTRQNFRGTK